MRLPNVLLTWRRWQKRFSPADKHGLSFGAEASRVRTASPLPRAQTAWPILLLIVTLLTGLIGNRFYNQPEFGPGTIVSTTITAPESARFEDTKSTEEERKAIQNGMIPVLKRDAEATQQTRQTLDTFIQTITKYRQSAGDIPFIKVELLSLEDQTQLRQLPDDAWTEFLVPLKSNVSGLNFPSWTNSAQFKRLDLSTQSFLNTLEPQLSSQVRRELVNNWSKIELARAQYAQTLTNLPSQSPNWNLTTENWAELLALSDEQWRTAQQALNSATERILIQGVPQGLPANLLEQSINLQLTAEKPCPGQETFTQFLLTILTPNLAEDTAATKEKAIRAADRIQPIYVEIQKGEPIVQTGETISQSQFVLLDGLGLSRRKINWHGLALTALLVTLAALFIGIIGTYRSSYPLRHRDYLVLGLLSLSAPLITLLGLKYSNLAAVGLLASSYYGSAVALVQVLLLTGLVQFATESSHWDFLLAAAAGGLLAAAVASRLRCRDDLALLGGVVGLVQGSVFLIVNLIESASAGAILRVLLPEAVVYGLAGLCWCIVALGISPYLERIFDLITPIRLAELANPNRPLLKRLATDAPGTFQHTLFVSSLAEAAARELRCNVELVRAGTLYHDIGKLHDPQGFIENQLGGVNKHDVIDNPWESAAIIKKHVEYGLVLARKYNLPQALQGFIPEHQGSLLISYFYYQAQRKCESDPDCKLEESHFRYDGPIPQSRETGIVMLADGCEAALRSLKDATPDIAYSTIHKIFKARWRAQQLSGSGIRYDELPKIAEVFVSVWQQHNHQRIAYPKGALELKPSKAVGS
ncbi:MAG: HDIG domain-containing metalloprotein [Cyanobacteria bacterium P01_H01_bin.15]